eukprot:1373560-Rhodomonas_salina.4
MTRQTTGRRGGTGGRRRRRKTTSREYARHEPLWTDDRSRDCRRRAERPARVRALDVRSDAAAFRHNSTHTSRVNFPFSLSHAAVWGWNQ